MTQGNELTNIYETLTELAIPNPPPPLPAYIHLPVIPLNCAREPDRENKAVDASFDTRELWEAGFMQSGPAGPGYYFRNACGALYLTTQDACEKATAAGAEARARHAADEELRKLYRVQADRFEIIRKAANKLDKENATKATLLKELEESERRAEAMRAAIQTGIMDATETKRTYEALRHAQQQDQPQAPPKP